MNKRSNITIEIVKLVALARGGGALLRTAKGWFLEFRLSPVLLWSYTAVVLGTAVAINDIGGRRTARLVGWQPRPELWTPR